MTRNRSTADESRGSAPREPDHAAVAEPKNARTALQSLVGAAVGAAPVQVIRRLRRGRWTLTEVYA